MNQKVVVVVKYNRSAFQNQYLPQLLLDLALDLWTATTREVISPLQLAKHLKPWFKTQYLATLAQTLTPRGLEACINTAKLHFGEIRTETSTTKLLDEYLYRTPAPSATSRPL